MTGHLRHPLTYLQPPARPTGTPDRRALSVYYGPNALNVLCRYRRVIVQPGHYRVDAVRWLQARGVQVLAYLSLGMDSSPHGDWLRGAPDPHWHLRPVDARHPEWRARIEAQVLAHRAVFDGFLLDTLDSASDPVQVRAMLKLVRQVRQWAGPCYLMANRGFGLLPRLGGTINGVLIEALSTTWADGYRMYERHELEYTAALVAQARRLHLEVYGLDYAVTTRARRFALRRAEALGVPTFVSNRELTLPGGLLPRLAAPERHAHGSLSSTSA
ncbi:hypothetical protein DEIGR_200083 [Deinococcus grandis]|uniref:Uncharacterized protein n=1 Tax=Deinococcus grandis TaxID=57498 RepID=A0A100HM54_9DEIO|nr:endo alpha-1,4 polygalactosaminidase [Deinococcus grandis]BBN96806.1 hypothetical protein DEGR_35390 [Deinococcus grandis]GAQ23228.1 hypothetical protein DEIGR_200083 [Deinococcus grandis]